MTDGALQGPPVLPRGSGSGQGGGVTHDVSDSASPPRGFASGLRGRLPVGLARRLTAAFVGLVTVVLVVNGAINLVFSYEEATTAAVQVQAEKAQAAAERVVQFIDGIESQMGWTTRAEWSRVGLDQRRYDFIRLLRQAPAITELIQLDGDGKEQLRLSRLEPDVVGSGKDYSDDPRFQKAVANKVWYGPVYFRRGSEPYMTLAIAHAGRKPGVTVASVNLKLIWDVITAIRVGQGGHAFVTDADGKLVAHPDMSLVLRGTDLAQHPQVAAAIQAGGGQGRSVPGTLRGLDGASVLSANAPIPKLGWFVFVELPTREALAPVWTSLMQTLALLGLGVLSAVFLGAWIAGRLVGPLKALQAGALRLGQGDLTQRISVRTGDEIGTLADRFNQMASQIQDSYETLEAKVEDRTRDLNLALQQQTATADVLKVISRSAFDLKTVLTTLIDTAVRLCNGSRGTIFLIKDGALEAAAFHSNVPPALRAHLEAARYPMDSDSLIVEAVRLGRITQIADAKSNPRWIDRDALTKAEFGSMLYAPLMRNGTPLGCFAMPREQVIPFSDREIEVVKTFVDQAVIAIENVRLFEEVQSRTRELTQSLDDLRAAQDRLVQSEKLASLGALTAGIAHEIKNPLNFVNNFADLSGELVTELEEAIEKAGPTLDPAIREDVTELAAMLKGNLEKVVQHGRRADSIVKNMLLHSREGGGERRAVDLNATVEEALNLAYHGARAEKPGFNITLERDYDPAAGTVEILPQEFTRVLLNLVGNGFHAAHKKRLEGAEPGFEPTLAVSTRAGPDTVTITVRDNGTGIPDAVKARIFEPFFTTKPAGEGTGLGLSLSHDIIVKQHGGTLAVDTSPGAYTAFTVTLPRGGPAGRRP